MRHGLLILMIITWACKIADIQFHSSHSVLGLPRSSRFSWARDGSSWPGRPGLTTNARMPFSVSWCIADKGFLASSAKAKTSPGITVSVDVIIKFKRLEPFYCVVQHWVWRLYPLVAPTQFRIDNLQVKLSILSSEVFQLVQSGEQQSCWIIRVLTESLSIGLSKEDVRNSSTNHMTTWNSPPATSWENTLSQFEP